MPDNNKNTVNNSNNNNSNPAKLTKFEINLYKGKQDLDRLKSKGHFTKMDSFGMEKQNYTAMGYKKAAKEGKWGTYIAPVNMAKTAYEQQTTRGIIADTVAGLAAKTASGFIRSFGNEDYVDMYNLAAGNYKDVKFGNWLTDIADQIDEYSNENHKIYQHHKGDWMNLAYAGQTTQGLGNTIGMMGGEALKQAALFAATGGAGNTLSLSTKAMRGLRVATAVLNGMKQGMVNAHSNARETYQVTPASRHREGLIFPFSL